MRLVAVLLLVGCGRIDFERIGAAAPPGAGMLDAGSADATLPGDAGQPACNVLPIAIRDFTSTHPDFHQLAESRISGLVAPELGADRTPVYAGGPTIASADSFRDWFHDGPASRRIAGMLAYAPGELASFGAEVFLPIDGQGFADSALGLDGLPHNFRFTVELHARFTAALGQAIVLTSDDDSWLFVDHQLVIDLGGLHSEATDGYDASALGPGDHEIDLFYAERLEPSAALRLQTTIQCLRAN
jgi:fibro-slime domain-containing protein